MPFSSIQEEEEALGSWPRRLLHVKSLTSYEWQPGNVYGGIKEPEYNAISYTWGRFRLKPGVSPEVQPLPFEGINWREHLPRMDPNYFTMEEFQNLINTATTYRLDESYGDQLVTKPVDFLWLDIACVDQNPSEPRSAAEIGRQALIYRGAQAVFVWAVTLLPNRHDHVFGNIEWWGVDPAEHTAETIQEPTKAMLDFLEVLHDPWFSSLWTLQEAFLRPNAIILTRPAQPIFYKVYGETSLLTLRHMLVWGVNADGFCTKRGAINSGEGLFVKIKDVINEKGLVALRANNTMALLGAATNRKCFMPEDRVYGIQQVFGFRLGKSSLQAEPGKEYTLEELEDQLGEALLIQEPILSQTHVFLEPVPYADRWKINACSAVPYNLQSINTSKTGNVETQASFWVDDSNSWKKAVRWKGPTTLLSNIAEYALWELGETAPEADDEESWRSYLLNIFPDVTDEFLQSPYYRSPPSSTPIPKGRESYIFAQWLDKRYSRQKVGVLFLGNIQENEQRQGLVIGLILVQQGKETWSRVGVCQWWIPKFSEEKEFFEGKSEEWKHDEGILGYVESTKNPGTHAIGGFI
ncbi:hypothetical protein CC78DRAFT_536143 [Lojkania enalia]|uniref:Heterokaryon incompatibility domain-containing protein n=1 Tax=Lojkania enalia TaxID=147567 RepID=A0A9P4K668_9PLEO|nr:hypothetical protein CC78DRAFT_536143 [Didymosphaeria enalia]